MGCMDHINALLKSPIFLATVFSWFIAQVMKSIIEITKNKPRSALKILKYIFWTTGGMPSSHSAVVAALVTSIGFRVGIGDPLFIVTFFYALLVIRDALGVRRSAGLQAHTLNRLIAVLKKEKRLSIKPVKEINGHSLSEVGVGAVLGFFIALAFCML
ncbi:MAG: divergent PAP2 family protein [Spirochaetales bacterium]|nr:divergent PAP2 family protein [Spirochaetales bacterium]